MKKIIGNTILNVKEIDRVEIVKRYEGFMYLRSRFDVDVYLKKQLHSNGLFDPKNYEYISVTVDSFKGPGAISIAKSLLTLIYQQIDIEKNKGSDEE